MFLFEYFYLENLLIIPSSAAPTINRHKMKSILNSTFDRFFSIFNTELKANIESLGSFCLTFDIWTSTAQTSYLGLIINYIDKDFKLVYKLLGKFIVYCYYI